MWLRRPVKTVRHSSGLAAVFGSLSTVRLYWIRKADVEAGLKPGTSKGFGVLGAVDRVLEPPVSRAGERS